LKNRRLLVADFELLKDINATPQTAGSSLENIVEVGSLSFFTATTATHGRELWKTDGTAAGTVMVKDINVGIGNSGSGF
jgi:ELWxxDGT repeat protein